MEIGNLKIILLVVSILGAIQGIITFVGGLVASEDSCGEEIDEKNTVKFGKYWCGMVRVEMTPNTTDNCSFERSDRGWFKRVYTSIKDGYESNGTHPQISDLTSLVGYEAVLASAIFLGLGWIMSSVMGLLATIKLNQLFAMFAAIGYSLFYIVFVGLFGAIWNSVRKLEDDCQPLFDQMCPEFKRRITRSSREILAYSICAFVIILVCIITMFYFALKKNLYGENLGKLQRSKIERTETTGIELVRAEPTLPAAEKVIEPESPPKEEPVPPAPFNVIFSVPLSEANPTSVTTSNKILVDSIADSKEGTILQEYSDRFKKLDKYLQNQDEKFSGRMARKFEEMDGEKTGNISFHEVRMYIATMMTTKDLPIPDETRMNEILKKYEKEGEVMEKEGFLKAVQETLKDGKEYLIEKYTGEKAIMLKATKPNVEDTQGAKNLEEKLKSPQFLPEELIPHLKGESMNLEEVAGVCEKLSHKYNVPILTETELHEMAKELGKEGPTYTHSELQFIVRCAITTAMKFVL